MKAAVASGSNRRKHPPQPVQRPRRKKKTIRNDKNNNVSNSNHGSSNENSTGHDPLLKSSSHSNNSFFRSSNDSVSDMGPPSEDNKDDPKTTVTTKMDSAAVTADRSSNKNNTISATGPMDPETATGASAAVVVVATAAATGGVGAGGGAGAGGGGAAAVAVAVAAGKSAGGGANSVAASPADDNDKHEKKDSRDTKNDKDNNNNKNNNDSRNSRRSRSFRLRNSSPGSHTNRRRLNSRLSIWHAPEFLNFLDIHSNHKRKNHLTLLHRHRNDEQNHGNKTVEEAGSFGGVKVTTTPTSIEATTAGEAGPVLEDRQQQPPSPSPKEIGHEGPGGDQPLGNASETPSRGSAAVEDRVLKILKHPLLRPIMNDEKAFNRLELNRDFVGCYLPDLALALRENTSIRHVFILEGWLATLSVKKAKILLGIIGSIPKLKTMSIRFPCKKFYLPVSTLVHLMSPATQLRRFKLWGIKLPRRRDVTMLSNTIPFLTKLQEFWIFAKGDVNLNPLIKSLRSLPELKMVYMSQAQNTKYLQGNNCLADLCSAPSQLEGLSLQSILMVNAQMEALFPVLASNTTLHWLSLQDITLRGGSVPALGQMLKTNRTLRWITLKNVGLDDQDCNLLAEALTLVKKPKKSRKSTLDSWISSSTNNPPTLKDTGLLSLGNSSQHTASKYSSSPRTEGLKQAYMKSASNLSAASSTTTSDTLTQRSIGLTSGSTMQGGLGGGGAAAAAGYKQQQPCVTLQRFDIRNNEKITSDGYNAFILMLQKNIYGQKPMALCELQTDAPRHIQEKINSLLDVIVSL